VKYARPIASRFGLNFSVANISRQQNYGMKPDAVCAIGGCCESGFEKVTNLIGNIIYTTEIKEID
jgi:hypothetical protein